MVKDGGEKVPIIQYVDDMVIFLEAKEGTVENLKAIIVLFEAATGLHVNARKTNVYPLNFGSDWLVVFDKWRYSVGVLSDTYLGVPLAATFK